MTDFDHSSENDPESPTWVALPDPSDEPPEWACWLCQADEPAFTLEITHSENGQGWVYRVCFECTEKLIGTLEEDKDD